MPGVSASVAKLSRKEIAVVVGTTAVALASVGGIDPWIVLPMLVVTWAALIYLCLTHEAPMKWRFTAAIVVSVVLAAVAARVTMALPIDRSIDARDAGQSPVTETAPRPEINEVVVQIMDVRPLEYLPEIKRQGIKVLMVLDNKTVPDAELQNVSGEVWTESKYLVGTIRKTPWDHPWERDRDRLRYRIWQPVLPKMSLEWLPTLVFALPPAGERAIYGAEIVSKTTDFRQYRWWLANEDGKGVVHGGDATPKVPGVVK